MLVIGYLQIFVTRIVDHAELKHCDFKQKMCDTNELCSAISQVFESWIYFGTQRTLTASEESQEAYKVIKWCWWKLQVNEPQPQEIKGLCCEWHGCFLYNDYWYVNFTYYEYLCTMLCVQCYYFLEEMTIDHGVTRTIKLLESNFHESKIILNHQS